MKKLFILRLLGVPQLKVLNSGKWKLETLFSLQNKLIVVRPGSDNLKTHFITNCLGLKADWQKCLDVLFANVWINWWIPWGLKASASRNTPFSKVRRVFQGLIEKRKWHKFNKMTLQTFQKRSRNSCKRWKYPKIPKDFFSSNS